MSASGHRAAAPRLVAATPERPEGVQRMSWPSRLYLAGVLAAAGGLTAALAPGAEAVELHWVAFSVLTVAAAVAQLFVVRKPGFQALKPSVIFVLAAALVLPVELLPVFTLLQYLPEWLRTRSMLKVASFNIANGVVDTVAASFAFHGLAGANGLPGSAAVHYALAGLAALVVYVGVNHLLLAVIIALTSNSSLRATGLFDPEHLMTDFVIGGLGVGVAALAAHNVWVAPFLVAPLVLIHRALAIPQLQAEARVDPKTGLFNARHFATTLAEELARAQRFERPLSLIMADLDLLRDINNTYGHLAGDVVLRGVAQIFRAQLRHYDVPARFGGEEFSILLPETRPEIAVEIAERIRRAVAEHVFETETAIEPIRATVSMGVAGFPEDGTDANELIHQADVAVYRAKLQGRNRVLAAGGGEPLLNDTQMRPEVIPLPVREDGPYSAPLAVVEPVKPAQERRRPRPAGLEGPRMLSLSPALALVVAVVSTLGIGAGVAGLLLGRTTDVVGLLAVIALVAGGQALSFELAEFEGAISVSAVGALAGAAMFDYRAALLVAAAAAIVDWSARRTAPHHVLYNVGTLSLAALSAAAVFSLGGGSTVLAAALGALGGAVYFLVNTALVSVASAVERHENPWRSFRERFSWLLPHYVVYGFVGSVIGIAYDAAGLYALAAFSVPLLLMRKTQEAYIRHTQRSAEKLRAAADTISEQNVSLEAANRLLRERTTAAMESLSATVDARDAYTAGHSRRVQQLALALGGELGLSQAELDLLGYAALFHDIGKLAVPDAILLKRGKLEPSEWALMRRHAEEGARIIERLGFLQDAVPAIRHHHERMDGSGYPEGLRGDEIPLGARIIHVADAFDSMLTTRIYRPARPVRDALPELRRGAGSQFCPRCVAALERVLALDELVGEAVAQLEQPLVKAS